MALRKPFHLQQWIDNHRSELQPPVCNQEIYHDAGDYIVMVVGGPNIRTDYHYNEGEELFYQIEGDMILKVVDDGTFLDVPIKEGEMFLLPGKMPHSPQRFEQTVGLVIELKRKEQQQDGLMWFCAQCNQKLYEEYFHLTDIVTQLQKVFATFYGNKRSRTCKSCGAVAEGRV